MLGGMIILAYSSTSSLAFILVLLPCFTCFLGCPTSGERHPRANLSEMVSKYGSPYTDWPVWVQWRWVICWVRGYWNSDILILVHSEIMFALQPRLRAVQSLSLLLALLRLRPQRQSPKWQSAWTKKPGPIIIHSITAVSESGMDNYPQNGEFDRGNDPL